MDVTKDSLYEDVYNAGYLHGKKDAYDAVNYFKETYKNHISNLINRAAAKNEWESVVYARQLLRSLK